MFTPARVAATADQDGDDMRQRGYAMSPLGMV